MINVIVVEDEADLRSSIARYLGMVGIRAREAENAHELDRLLAQEPAHVVLLDINLPGEDGFSIATRLRDSTPARIIMMTARGQIDDRVQGLNIGADAYLVKPVQFRELEAMIHSVARRMRETAGTEPAPKTNDHGSWEFDSASWTLVTPNGGKVSLTNAEFKVIQALASNPGNSTSREEIMASLGKVMVDYEDRSIDAILARLRRKVQASTGENLPIKSARSIGYVFAGPIINRA